jgi:hypothetical protein
MGMPQRNSPLTYIYKDELVLGTFFEKIFLSFVFRKIDHRRAY